MATLANVTISDSGHFTLPSGNTAQRPTTPTISTSLNLPFGISSDNLKLYIPAFWAVYQNLPQYLTGLITTIFINSSDAFTCTVSHACRIYMLRDVTWNAVDVSTWTLLESNRSYISVAPTSTNVYFKDVAAGSHTLDNNSAMYMFDFGTNVSVRKGMMRFNTDSQCIEWYNGLRWANDIVRDGLICHVDIGNSESYSGIGTTVRDISGHGRHFLAFNSPTFSDTFYGVMQFNTSGQYLQQIDMNLTNGTSTIMAATRYTGGTGGRTISSVVNNWLLGHWTNSTENYFAEGWVTSVAAGPNDTNWRIYTGTTNTTTDSYTMYVNGVQTASNNGGGSGVNQIQINGHQGGLELSNCQFSFLLAYNRVLTAAEVRQNYNAFRWRFGL